MRVASLRWRFTAERVRETPDLQGVYTLWDGKECVFVGHTPWNHSLQQCLRAHLGLSDEGAIRASHFTWETTSTPKSREQEILERRVEAAQGRLPRYNVPGSPLAPTKTSVTDLHARS